MNRIFCCFWMICLLSSPGAVAAQDFFWSLSNLGEGAVQGDLAVNVGFDSDLNIGDQLTLFLYYNTSNSELDTGAGLDLSFSNDGVFGFVAAETFDFDVVLTFNPTVVINTRWGDAFGPANDVQMNSVTGLNAFTVVAGDGISDAGTGNGTFLDLGYDADSDAFLFGSVTVERLGAGETEILIEPGEIGIVHDGQTVNATFGAAVFVVPEPGVMNILTVTLFGLLARRRRQISQT